MAKPIAEAQTPAPARAPRLSTEARRDFAVIVPAYNEVDNVADLVRELHQTFRRQGLEGEVVLVDDGSRGGPPPRGAAPRRPRAPPPRGWWGGAPSTSASYNSGVNRVPNAARTGSPGTRCIRAKTTIDTPNNASAACPTRKAR
jgi:hypothetical protein